jgi:uncharacterized membrane protein YpjA
VVGENIVVTVTLRSITAVVPALTYTVTKEYIPYLSETSGSSNIITHYPIIMGVNSSLLSVAALIASGEF